MYCVATYYMKTYPLKTQSIKLCSWCFIQHINAEILWSLIYRCLKEFKFWNICWGFEWA
jgi:hypothetical protein